MKCKEIVLTTHNGFNHYSQCDKDAKYKANFIGGNNGEYIDCLVCGIHLNSIKKKELRLKEKVKFDIKLTIIKL